MLEALGLGGAGLGAIGFLSPLWLTALAGLPILYWLLRITPPAPKRALFPAIRLLLRLDPKEETPAQTPWWLLLLRLVIAALVILALAHPLLNPRESLVGAGPVVVVVDDGWASARSWPKRRTVLGEVIDRAEREDRPVMLLATAPSIAGDAPRPTRLMPAGEARPIAAALEPKSWPVDRAAARAALGDLSFPRQASIVYLADGLADPELDPLLERLQRLGAVDLIEDPPENLARLLMPPTADSAGLAVTAVRAAESGADQVVVRATAEDGRLLARENLRWNAGERSATIRLSLPTELRNRIARLEIDGESSAGAVVLMDERWRRRPVGLVSGGPAETQQPLLADVYYLERALSPFSEVRQGTVSELLRREIAVVILADVARVPDAERKQLEEWMGRGGMVLRFAGPRMGEGADDLIPVPLRAGGGRSFGGAMTWAQPVGISAFENASPFAGLAVPADVRVTRQVLAEPSLDLPTKTWARLADGTPLVTADKRGDGWIVLVHTTANPDWSSLPISGLFVQMLQRLVALSQGVASAGGDALLPPMSALDGFGRLQAPPPAAVAINARTLAQTSVGPKSPPGFYGSEAGRVALNLASAVPAPRAVESVPPGVGRVSLAAAEEVDFKPWLLAAALALALLDLLISLHLRGLSRRRVATAAVLLGLMAAPSGLSAQPASRVDDSQAIAATLTTRFGYVRTGRDDVDDLSRVGLTGLGQVLTRRTAVDVGAPLDVDVERDELSFFPMLYWPVMADSPRPSADAIARITRYLRTGGTILFDTKEGEALSPNMSSPAASRLREILRQLNLAPLTPVPAGHVLTKSFYLLSDFPGRFTGSPVWVEQGDDRVNDGVSSVIIGANDWVAAWATDQQGRALYAAVPGGEAQRETAVRFGVNLVMYVLTGNYKADQVHVEAILDRMRR